MKRTVSLSAAVIAVFLLLPPSAHAQGVATLGIGGIQTSIRGADPLSFQTMLETQLVKTNKFRIIERSRLAEILKEKGLGAAGVSNSGASISGIEGVDYLIYGSITKLGKAGSATSIGGGVAFGGNSVEMAVDLRVIDAHTGEILKADAVSEQTTAGSAFKGLGFSSGKSTADPLADVERLTAKSITALITTTIYPIKVIAKQADGTYVVNYGDSVLSDGDLLRVMKVGESFKDPDTGKVLGAEETEVGVLRVKETSAAFSKTSLVSGEVAVGNQAKRVSTSDSKSTGDRRNGAKLP